MSDHPKNIVTAIAVTFCICSIIATLICGLVHDSARADGYKRGFQDGGRHVRDEIYVVAKKTGLCLTESDLTLRVLNQEIQLEKEHGKQ